MEKTRKQETLKLAEEILRDIEEKGLELSKILRKCMRLARLNGNHEALDFWSRELQGYNVGEEALAKKKGRGYMLSGKWYNIMHGVPLMETMLTTVKDRLQLQKLPSSLSGPNDRTIFFAIKTVQTELSQNIECYSLVYETIKHKVYTWTLNVYSALQTGLIPQTVFEQVREFVDNSLQEIAPDALKQFVSVYDNLVSSNQEDWANAVHSCRRILKAVADKLYSPTKEVIEKTIKGKKTKIELGKDKWKNRLICFIEKHSGSKKFKEVVGSHLEYIVDRINSVAEAVSKGTHHKVGKEEARRYIVYTYLLIGDILSLTKEKNLLEKKGDGA